jgi:hypothetical protein
MAGTSSEKGEKEVRRVDRHMSGVARLTGIDNTTTVRTLRALLTAFILLNISALLALLSYLTLIGSSLSGILEIAIFHPFDTAGTHILPFNPSLPFVSTPYIPTHQHAQSILYLHPQANVSCPTSHHYSQKEDPSVKAC